MTFTMIGLTEYAITSKKSLLLTGPANNGDSDTLPCVVFGYISGSTLFPNMASIQGEAKLNCALDIVFYTRVGIDPTLGESEVSKWGRGYASTASEKLRIVSYGATNTTTSVKITGICETTAGFNVSSSLKYKKNIQDLPDNYNLDMLMKYRPIMYNLKVDELEKPTFFPGFIAEEIEELGGNLFLTYKDDEPEALDYSRICVHLVKAIQEIKTDYDSKIANLEQKYEELKIMMNILISQSKSV